MKTNRLVGRWGVIFDPLHGAERNCCTVCCFRHLKEGTYLFMHNPTKVWLKFMHVFATHLFITLQSLTRLESSEFLLSESSLFWQQSARLHTRCFSLAWWFQEMPRNWMHTWLHLLNIQTLDNAFSHDRYVTQSFDHGSLIHHQTVDDTMIRSVAKGNRHK